MQTNQSLNNYELNLENAPLEIIRAKWCEIQFPYKTARQKSGAIVIKSENLGKDIFDLPPEKLTKFIQGVIWRDEHFGGMTLKDIAYREHCSEAYVGTAIFGSFDILQQALSSS